MICPRCGREVTVLIHRGGSSMCVDCEERRRARPLYPLSTRPLEIEARRAYRDALRVINKLRSGSPSLTQARDSAPDGTQRGDHRAGERHMTEGGDD